jgi:hypothetical protein
MLTLMLMAGPPAVADNLTPSAGTNDLTPSAEADDLTGPKIATIAISAVIAGSLFYLMAEWLFVETVETTTTLGGTRVQAASDMAEHSGIITGMTLSGLSLGAILGGIGYDRYHSDHSDRSQGDAGNSDAVAGPPPAQAR